MFLQHKLPYKLHWVRNPLKTTRDHFIWPLLLKSNCTHGQFGSTLWSTWWEEARPSNSKKTNLIFEYLVYPFRFYWKNSSSFLMSFVLFIVKDISLQFNNKLISLILCGIRSSKPAKFHVTVHFFRPVFYNSDWISIFGGQTKMALILDELKIF